MTGVKQTVTDAELIRRYRNGDQTAFETLYARYRKPLYSYLNGMLPGNPARVDDLYQQAWLKALDSLSRYRDRQKFLAWLFRIAHNTAVDAMRREKHTETLKDADCLPAPARDTPGDNDRRRELHASIEQAVNALPTEQAEVFRLRQQNMSFKEIAGIQKVSVNTVLGRMRYATKKLQKKLAAWSEFG